LVTKRIAVRGAIVVLVVGAVLVALGAVTISESGPHMRQFPKFGPVIPEEPMWTVYIFDVTQLVTGIILTLAGTATVSASLTCLLLDRKKEGV
jgi:hypothetical protein